MWNNVRQLNAAASLLSAAALLALLGAAGYWLAERPMFALHGIAVEGDIEHVNAPTIRADVVGNLHGNFFTVDLDRARAAFESMPWVRRASVRRVWPDRLAVSLEEYTPLGTWGDNQLVSVDGDLFTANQGEIDKDIPEFSGPPGTEKMVVQRYRDFQKWLAPLGSAPEAVTLSARYAWTVRLANGLQIDLGRERTDQTLDERTKRLVKAWPQIVKRWGNDIESADLRYPNGLAIRAASMRFTNDPSVSKGLN
jgi:cell division protein FtsQ